VRALHDEPMSPPMPHSRWCPGTLPAESHRRDCRACMGVLLCARVRVRPMRSRTPVARPLDPEAGASGPHLIGEGLIRTVDTAVAASRSFIVRVSAMLRFGLREPKKESPKFRSISRSRKIRMRPGGSASLFERFPEKPHRMHWRTYHRLRARGEAADATAFAYL
jgi:hypothetical protein